LFGIHVARTNIGRRDFRSTEHEDGTDHDVWKTVQHSRTSSTAETATQSSLLPGCYSGHCHRSPAVATLAAGRTGAPVIPLDTV